MAKSNMNQQTSAEADLKAMAKTVGKNLRQKGHAVPHSILLHALSAALGKTDWHSLKAHLNGPAAPSTTSFACGTPGSWLPCDPQTLFWVRLAAFKGLCVYRKADSNALWTYSAEEGEAPLCADAKTAARRSLNALLKGEGDSVIVGGVLDLHGWVMPVDVDMNTRWLEGQNVFPHASGTGTLQLFGVGSRSVKVAVECVKLGERQTAWRISELGWAQLEAYLAQNIAQPFALDVDRFEVIEILGDRDVSAVTHLTAGAVEDWSNLDLTGDFWAACEIAQKLQAQQDRPVWVIDRLGGSQAVVFKATPARLPAATQKKQGPAVRANFHTDDRVKDFDFDASGWLAQAEDKDIRALFSCGLGGDYPADDIAYWMEPRDEAFKSAFVYLSALQEANRDCGFEVRVDAGEFGRWMQLHRPAVLAKALCEHFEVTVCPAEEPELRGMWDWLGDTEAGDSRACDRSFETEDDAARDAAEVLRLWPRFLQEQARLN